MLDRLRAVAARVWPVLRLRTVFFATLLFVAALPGVAALTLRVYENALVRRTEAELIAQGAAIAASAAMLLPGEDRAARLSPEASDGYADTASEVDLRSSPVLPERPAAVVSPVSADPALQAVADRLDPVIDQTKQATLASILLVDSRGVLLNGRDRGRSLVHVAEVRRALTGRAATSLRLNDAYSRTFPLAWISRATNIRLHHARPIIDGGKVVGAVLVSRSPSALFRGMWEDWGKILFGVVAIFASLVLLTAVFARAIVRPIERLSAATRELASGQGATLRRPTLEVVEIRSLFDDFSVMAAAIARRSRYLRDFAASLSHEFKTPLAGLCGGIELMQDHGETMSAEERSRFLANMAGDADRLSRLVSRLMELARADMAAAGDARSEVAPILARLRDAHSSGDFAVIVGGEAGSVAIRAEALESVLATLIENARQAGATRLEIGQSREEGRARIALADNGPGVPPADRERVFDPFFTSKRASGGTGLGLPIARALVENGGGSLTLADAEHGACFVLELPLAG